jgi:hypothetical protein
MMVVLSGVILWVGKLRNGFLYSIATDLFICEALVHHLVSWMACRCITCTALACRSWDRSRSFCKDCALR